MRDDLICGPTRQGCHVHAMALIVYYNANPERLEYRPPGSSNAIAELPIGCYGELCVRHREPDRQRQRNHASGDQRESQTPPARPRRSDLSCAAGTRRFRLRRRNYWFRLR
jgi:hypothetical protein